MPVEPLTVKGRPTCSATLELPYPFSVEDQNLRGKEIIGFQPLILDADTKAADNSLQTARKHYGKTSLFTDDEGARILIDGIGLEFDTVSVDLNELAHSDPEWWTLGKMMTYRAQTEPFVHIDEDVFLWQRLPRELEQAPVFAQNAEYFSCAAWWYQPEALESVVKEHRGWLPDEWIWYRSSGQAQRGECCGIVGGSRVDFVRYWADLGIRMIEHPQPRRLVAADQ